jgi:cytochrome c oxidase subunit 2
MKGLIKVVTKDEFILWKAKQKPAYAVAFPAPEAAPAPAADTTKAAVTVASK